MGANSKNTGSISSISASTFNKLSASALLPKIGIGMVSMLLTLSAATIATLEVSNQSQSVDSEVNEAENIVAYWPYYTPPSR